MGTKDYWWLDGKFFEQEGARVLQETGVIGFILVYAARIWLLVKAISLGVRFRTPLYAAMAGVIAGFFAQYLFLIVINNPTGGIYYWFAAGLLFAMYRLELQEATAPLPASASRRQLGREEVRGARRPLTACGNQLSAMRRCKSGQVAAISAGNEFVQAAVREHEAPSRVGCGSAPRIDVRAEVETELQAANKVVRPDAEQFCGRAVGANGGAQW